MTYQSPSLQPINPPSLKVLLDAVSNQVKREINCVRVGQIQSYDATKQEATVKIAQQQVTSTQPDGTRTLSEFPLLLRCPVVYPSGGGFTLTFPIAAGDECLILFNDREIDNWVTSGAGQAPTTARMHDLSDGFALVGVRSNPRALTSVSTSATQLRSDDGETYVEVSSGSIKLVAPTGILLDTPLVTVTGDIEAGDDAISSVHHKHDGVQTGGGDTGEPIP